MRSGTKCQVMLALMVMAWGGQAEAVEPFARTPEEEALCKVHVYGSGAKDLQNRDDWQHMHHYCDCIRFRYRAIRSMSDKYAYKYNLGIAVGGCDYVLKHTRTSFVMRPKVHVDKGKVLKLMGDTGGAVREFMTAMDSDRSETSAYHELSLLQQEQGQKSAALETVVLGLRHNPEAKLLQNRYLELGGKRPFPEPIARVEREPERIVPQPESSMSTELAPVEPVVPVDVSAEGAIESVPGGEEGEAVGANGGRSCRFCPPEEIQRRWIESFKSTPEKKPE